MNRTNRGYTRLHTPEIALLLHPAVYTALRWPIRLRAVVSKGVCSGGKTARVHSAPQHLIVSHRERKTHCINAATQAPQAPIPVMSSSVASLPVMCSLITRIR